MSTTAVAQDLVGTPSATAPPSQPPKLTLDTIAGLEITGPAEEGYINMLIYGDPGVGKTRLAGSACMVKEMAPVLFLDFEGGTLSLSHDYRECKVVRAKTWAKVAELINDLYKSNPFNTVVVDSLTEIQKFCMREIMRDVVKANPDRDPDIASLREWGKQGEALRRVLTALRDLPCNTIFTALQHEARNDAGKVIKVTPGLPGQLKGEVAGYVDIVAFMYKKEVVSGTSRTTKTLILTQGTEAQVAKDRSGQLPAIMEAPTMQAIYNAINGQGETDEA